MMKKILTILIGILMVLVSVSGAFALDGFSYKKPLTITNNANENLTNYQVRTYIDTATLIGAGKMQNDCDDVRFLDSDDSTGLNYFLESHCNTNATIFWVNVTSVPASGQQTIYMYYGNSTETSDSNPNSTFILYDDFDGTSLENTTIWYEEFYGNGGTVTVSGGEVHLTNNGAGRSSIRSRGNWSIPHAIEGLWSGSTGSAGNDHRSGLCFEPETAFFRDCDESDYFFSTQSYRGNMAGVQKLAPRVPELRTVAINTSEYLFLYLNYSQIYTENHSLWVNPTEQGIMISSSWSSAQTNDWDWARVRVFTHPEPVTSEGAEEVVGEVVVDWDTLPVNDMTYQSKDFNFQYNVSEGILNITCDLFIDTVLNQTDVHASLGIKSFTVDADGLTETYHSFYVNCSNVVNSEVTSTKTIYIDRTPPQFTITQPAINSSHYLPNGLPIDLRVDNVELETVVLTLYDSGEVLKFNDTEFNVSGNVSIKNYTINSSDLGLGAMRLNLFALDEANLTNEFNISLSIFNCTELAENWTAQYTSCDTSDQQVLVYTDQNSCGTVFNLPVDNGTNVSCNYCTADITETTSSCFVGLRNITYTLVNNATCCALTNISADCDLPSDVIGQSCNIGTHSASDIPAVVIDNIGALGVEAIRYAPLIVIVTLIIAGLGIIAMI